MTGIAREPNAAAIAQQRLARDPSAQRAQVVAGDFFKDPIPSGHAEGLT